MAKPPILELMQGSQWVIRGRVKEVGASNVPEVPASSQVCIVTVDEILHGPPEFTDHLGREVTLYTDHPKGLASGRSAVFFTRSWVYSDSLAVVEVGRISKKNGVNVADEIAAAEGQIKDDRLLGRIRLARMVVAGKVAETRPASKDLRARIETEHDPDWWVALFEVGDVLMGDPPGRVIEILFAASTDEMWIDSPKFAPGEAALLMLQSDQQEKGWPVLRVPGLTALDPLDRQPLDEIDHIRELIESGRRR
jgi:hypothetical protein